MSFFPFETVFVDSRNQKKQVESEIAISAQFDVPIFSFPIL